MMKCYKNILHKGLRRDPVGGQENNTIRKSLTLLIKLSGECLCNTNFIQKQFGRFTHKKDVKHVVKRSAISGYGAELCAGRVGRAKARTATATSAIYTEDGNLLAEAEVLLVDIPDLEMTAEQLEALGWKVYPENVTSID